MDWTTSTLAEPFKAVFWGIVRTPAEKQNWDSIHAGRQACIDALATVDKALAEQPYLSGNEIGMGRVEDYAIEGVVDHGENIACTVPTDQLVVAGTSNWGAHALVCAMRALGSNAVDPYLEPTWQERVLDVIVEYGGLDGVHMTNVATVDGLEPDRYFKQVGQLTDCARS